MEFWQTGEIKSNFFRMCSPLKHVCISLTLTVKILFVSQYNFAYFLKKKKLFSHIH